MPLQLLPGRRHAGVMTEDSLPEGDDSITERILLVRGQRVLLDADLAAMYGVTTKRLNEQVRRNLDRFPPDFSFILEDQDFAILRSQFATSNARRPRRGGRRYLPRAFTEHGAIMAATLLNSPRAIHMSVYVVRTFVKLRKLLASNTSTIQRLEALERSVAALGTDTRKEFDQVYEAILGLMSSTKRQ
jgi:hypothetical protein